MFIISFNLLSAMLIAGRIVQAFCCQETLHVLNVYLRNPDINEGHVFFWKKFVGATFWHLLLPSCHFSNAKCNFYPRR
jgi:hypothetical protein